MLPLIPLLAALTLGDSVPQRTPPADPGASFSVHRQQAVPLVALRMALLADDPAGYAGTGHLVQHLVLPTLRTQVERVGGTVEMERSADAVVYTVTGPVSELDYLAGTLTSALRPPAPTEPALLRASRELAEERLEEWESADQHIRSDLRNRLFPGDLSAAGTERSAARFSPGEIPELWREMYAPDRLTILAVGDLTLAELRAAFANLPTGAPGGAAESADTVSLAPLAPAEATHGWLGAGYLASGLNSAAVTVAARMARDHLEEQLPGVNVTAEHWWTHHGQALVVILAAEPNRVAAARRALNTLASELETDLTERSVATAARAIRRDMLFYARTPERMAEVLGRFTDRAGDPDAAESFYAQLAEVDRDEVREVMLHMLSHTPTRVEIAAPTVKSR